MKTTIAICAAGLLLAAVLIVWQARALARRELVCKFCGKQLRLPWNQLLLRQHVGKPAVPVVRTGDRVHAGDVVAEIPEKSLGARIHAPIDGIVTRVDAKAIQVAGGESA